MKQTPDTRGWATSHRVLFVGTLVLPLVAAGVAIQSISANDSDTPAIPAVNETPAPQVDSSGGGSTSTSSGVLPLPTTTAPLPASGATTTLPAISFNRVFAATSPFNTPIGEDPVLDPRSDQIADLLGETVVADLYQFGIAIYDVDSETVPVSVDCTRRWGRCPLETGLHRIPEYAEPAPGSDGTLVVIDWSERSTVEMWQPAQQSDGSWITSWGTTTSIDGTGVPDVFGNGAGISHLAGVVRVEEIEQGLIDHALVFSTSGSCQDEYRYPATKTDGRSDRDDCIPEGARIQLDPSVDLDTLRLTPAERAIAAALQKYGAYAVDTGGTAMAIYFEIAADATPSNPGSVYTAAGLTRDYFPLQAIPWADLVVLNSWDGS